MSVYDGRTDYVGEPNNESDYRRKIRLGKIEKAYQQEAENRRAWQKIQQSTLLGRFFYWLSRPHLK